VLFCVAKPNSKAKMKSNALMHFHVSEYSQQKMHQIFCHGFRLNTNSVMGLTNWMRTL
jgi:hypothetical protein